MLNQPESKSESSFPLWSKVTRVLKDILTSDVKENKFTKEKGLSYEIIKANDKR